MAITSKVKVVFLKVLILVGAALAVLLLYRGNRFQHNAAPTSSKSGQSVAERPDLPGKPQSGGANDEHELKVLSKALEQKPGHTPVLFQLAQLEIGKGQYQDADRHLQEILRKEPDNPEARLELGRVRFQIGDIRGAIEQTEQILKTHPDYPDALFNLGAIYGNLGNKERAEEYWKRLIASNPQSETTKMARQMMTKLQASAR